jgi:hypothetical protein
MPRYSANVDDCLATKYLPSSLAILTNSEQLMSQFDNRTAWFASKIL